MSIRIAKYIADSGVASRRQAEELIEDGRVSLNGRAVKSPVCFVKDGDVVAVDGKRIHVIQGKILIAFHKPINTMTTRNDPGGRRTIYDMLPTEYRNLKYIGRLDYRTTGLLLLTNDGDLARGLTLPSSRVPRIYYATVGPYSHEKLEQARHGMTIDGITYAPMKIDELPNGILRVEITEGKKNEVRIVLRACGSPVRKLRRESFGPVVLGNLGVGKVRVVEQKVIDALEKYILTSQQ